ncbi:Hemolysin A [bioreactor metagenome]|uniref:Hemolysin A n=1 Tax=bioreactor metagenome TaxID=1076179 RepID=A0A644ZVJ1_9ZZZZ
MRLDLYLVQQGYFPSRQKAIDAIKNNRVKINSSVVAKPSYDIDNDKQIEVMRLEADFVSRAGIKLHYALQYFHVELKNSVCLDIGSSTGGFTDCCLQHGARLVYAIDVGTNQLDTALRCDQRVILRENTNARMLTTADFETLPDFICMDVSFISVKLLIPTVASLLKSGKEAVILIKPQFEVGQRFLTKKGIVKDSRQEKRVLDEIASLLLENNLIQSNYIKSPIKGREGKIEYLVYLIKK